MSRLLEISVLALGGLCLFAVSFLGFALSAGVPMKDVAVVGSLFGEDEPAVPQEVAVTPPPPVVVKTDGEVVRDHLALLSLWSLEPPFEPDELDALVDRLRARSDELERRMDRVEEREAQLDDKSRALSEQHATLEEIRAELETYEADLRLREAELGRDLDSKEARAAERWDETAALFADGDAGDLASRLQQFTPEESARILRSLDDARARELLDALPDEQWKTYASAYTSAPSVQPRAER